MRENRLAKLAGLKKIAEDGSYDDSYKSKSISELYEVLSRELMSLINVDEDAVKAAGYYLGKSNGTEEEAIKYFRTNHPSHAGDSKSLKEAMDNKRSDMYDNFKQGFTKGRAEAYLEVSREAAQDSPQTTAPVAAAPKSRASGRRRAPEAMRDYTKLTAPRGTTLTETAGNITYHYMIYAQNSFGFNTDGTDRYKKVDNSYSKWENAAETLNTLYGKTTPIAAAAPAVPAPAPAAAPAATPATTVLDQNLIQKVAVVLNKALLFRLNLQSVQSEQDEIRSLKNKLGSIDRLAAIIVSRVGENLRTLSAATLAEINSGTRKDLAVNMKGRFAGDVGTILRQVSEITRMENISRGSIKRLAERLTETPASPTATAPTTNTPATTAPAAADADDGQDKKASLNKKFIKAATLRRLKIRSQMEAAIDSSAQMGRARVS